jgi:hypothetical protein
MMWLQDPSIVKRFQVVMNLNVHFVKLSRLLKMHPKPL